MKLSFHRGTLVKADGSSSALSLSWAHQCPQAFLLGNLGERTPHHLHPISDGFYTAEHPVFGHMALAKMPWWSELPAPPAEKGVWLSYQGMFEGIWHDGIFGRYEDFQWTDLVMPGAKFTLEFGSSQLPLEDPQGFFEQEKFFAQKQSLIYCMKAQFPRISHQPLSLGSSGSSADFILGLLLMRLAFPQIRLSILPDSVAWKRLAQNLNIEPLKASATPLTVLGSFGPREKVVDLLCWQQSRSPFIPQHLLNSLLT